MTSRIVLFGATGFTGELTARSLVARGHAPVLVGRRAAAVQALASELGDLPTATVDVEAPTASAQLAELLKPGDVLISTVGPFLKWGQPALEAATSAGAHYLDSTGEPPFIRRVYEQFGPGKASGTVLTAMGYDYMPGNLAAALALEAAGSEATSVRVGYFATGRAEVSSISSGTRASMLGVMLEPSFAWRGGNLVTERSGAKAAKFTDGTRARGGVSVGGSEHFGLPPVFGQLVDVEVYLGWGGDASPAIAVGSAVLGAVTSLPGARSVLGKLSAAATARAPMGGPGPEQRATTKTLVIAEAMAGGRQLSRVRLTGPNPYELTGDLLAWGAGALAAGQASGPGALGPVQAFGLKALSEAATDLGMKWELSS